MRKFLIALMLVLTPALAAAQTVLAPPSVKWAGQFTVPTPVQNIGYDSGTGLPCIVGSTATCSIPTSGGSGGSVIITPTSVSTTDKSGTITTGGTAQSAIASNASRKGWCIMNPSTATETLQVRSNGAATVTTGVALAPGQQACNQPNMVDTSAVSVLATTTAHAYFGFEVQ